MATDPKTIVRRFDDELFNERNPAAAETILAEDVVWHHPTLGEIRGRQALLEVIQEMHTAYHDIVDTVKHMVAEGDMVATHWSLTGTHRQPYRGRAPSACAFHVDCALGKPLNESLGARDFGGIVHHHISPVWKLPSPT